MSIYNLFGQVKDNISDGENRCPIERVFSGPADGPPQTRYPTATSPPPATPHSPSASNGECAAGGMAGW